MPLNLHIFIGKPHKQGDPLVCCRCNKKLKEGPGEYDEMRDTQGNRWLSCEACTVEMFSGAQIEIEY